MVGVILDVRLYLVLSGLSHSTLYRATIHLKGQDYTDQEITFNTLYTIDPDFIYGDRSNRKVSGQGDVSDMSDRLLYNRTNTKELS